MDTVLNRIRVAGTEVSESFTHWAKNRATQVDRVFQSYAASDA